MTTSHEVLITSEASGQMWNVCVWDLQSSTSLLTYKGGTSSPHGIAVLGSDFLVSALTTKPILMFWSLQKRDNQQMKMVCPGRVTALDITPDGAYCIAAISEKIHIWQVCTGNLLQVLSRHYQDVTCVRCSSDGSHFVSGGDDNLVIVWSLGRVLAESGEQSRKTDPSHVWSQHSLPVTDVHIGYGGERARVVSSSLDQTCRLWDVASGELLCCFVFDVGIMSTTIDLSETTLYAGGNSGTIYSVKLFEMPVRAERHITKETDEGCSVFTGHTIIVQSKFINQQVIPDILSLEFRSRFESKQVSCLSLSMDGSQLVSGSHDCSVRVWDVYSGQCTKTISHKGVLTNVKVIVTPPVVNSEHKAPQIPVKTFQRNLYLTNSNRDVTEGDNSSDCLNLYMDRFQQVIEKHSTSDSSLQDLQDSTIRTTDDTELRQLRNTVQKLTSANNDMFQYIAKDILKDSS